MCYGFSFIYFCLSLFCFPFSFIHLCDFFLLLLRLSRYFFLPWQQKWCLTTFFFFHPSTHQSDNNIPHNVLSGVKILKYIAFSSHDHYNIWCEFGLLYGFSIRFLLWLCVCVLLLAMLFVTDKNNDLSVSFGFTQSYLLNTHTQLVCHLFHSLRLVFVHMYTYMFECVCARFVQSDFGKNSKHQAKNNKQKQSGGQRKWKTKKNNQKKRHNYLLSARA